MKLNVTGSEIVSEGDFEQSQYQIEVSAHAFNILSKGLYSDPHKAIVRELACNAWDSHVAAGNTDRPFDVYLPNYVEPIFKIRDYGTGMSEETMKVVYKSYFKSTKQASNDMTGCFGLGSKSPFALVDKFTAISYFNGIKYTYVNFLDDRRIPGLAKLAEEATDEPNGMEISMEIPASEIDAILRAARKTLHWFKVRPELHGVNNPSSFFNDPGEVYASGPGWRILKDGYVFERRSHHTEERFVRINYGARGVAVMGNVAYELPTVKPAGMSADAFALFHHPIVVEFPLGAFEITPSREAIQWTEMSVTAVNDRFEEIYHGIITEALASVETAATRWDALVTAKRITYTSPFAPGIQGIQFDWNGETLSVSDRMSVPDSWRCELVSAIHTNRDTATQSRLTKEARQTITPHENPEFWVLDYPSAERRLDTYLRDLRFEKKKESIDCLVFRHQVQEQRTSESGLTYTAKVDNYKVSQNEIDALAAALGTTPDKFKLVSSIPDKPRVPRVAQPRAARLKGTEAHAFKFLSDKYSGHSADHYWDECLNFDLTSVKEGVYVEISRWNLQNCKGLDVNKLLEAFKYAPHLFKGLEIIGVKTADLDKFQKASNWKTLDTYLEEKSKELWAQPCVPLAYSICTNRDYAFGNFIATVLDFDSKLKVKGQVWNDYVAHLRTLQTALEVASTLEQGAALNLDFQVLSEMALSKYWGNGHDYYGEPEDWTTPVQALRNKYPLLNTYSRHDSEDKPLIEYLEAVQQYRNEV